MAGFEEMVVDETGEDVDDVPFGGTENLIIYQCDHSYHPQNPLNNHQVLSCTHRLTIAHNVGRGEDPDFRNVLEQLRCLLQEYAAI